jgi:hypothetical protein
MSDIGDFLKEVPPASILQRPDNNRGQPVNASTLVEILLQRGREGWLTQQEVEWLNTQAGFHPDSFKYNPESGSWGLSPVYTHAPPPAERTPEALRSSARKEMNRRWKSSP